MKPFLSLFFQHFIGTSFFHSRSKLFFLNRRKRGVSQKSSRTKLAWIEKKAIQTCSHRIEVLPIGIGEKPTDHTISEIAQNEISMHFLLGTHFASPDNESRHLHDDRVIQVYIRIGRIGDGGRSVQA